MIQLYQRIKQKIQKEIKKHHRQKTPFQNQTTFIEKDGTHWYEPILVGPSTFTQACTSAKTVIAVSSIIEKLTPDRYLSFNLNYYKAGLERFADQWRYADINTFLYGICSNISVDSYLEIGVRRGRSMSIVAALHPKVNIVGFDMWLPNYAGNENPGPDFVRQELAKIGFEGKLELISGNSHKTVPEYFRKNPNAYFDLITVDGDHTIRGARQDLETVIPRLKIGGVLVFDDICNPDHTYLKKVWEKVIGNRSQFQTYSFEELGYGVAFAIRNY